MALGVNISRSAHWKSHTCLHVVRCRPQWVRCILIPPLSPKKKQGSVFTNQLCKRTVNERERTASVHKCSQTLAHFVNEQTNVREQFTNL